MHVDGVESLFRRPPELIDPASPVAMHALTIADPKQDLADVGKDIIPALKQRLDMPGLLIEEFDVGGRQEIAGLPGDQGGTTLTRHRGSPVP
jgi:hypothetical protein